MISSIFFKSDVLGYRIEEYISNRLTEFNLDKSIIQEIIFLGYSKTVPHWQEWKIILSSSNLQSSIEQAISSLARIIILEQKSLNEENVAKCRNPQE